MFECTFFIHEEEVEEDSVACGANLLLIVTLNQRDLFDMLQYDMNMCFNVLLVCCLLNMKMSTYCRNVDNVAISILMFRNPVVVWFAFSSVSPFYSVFFSILFLFHTGESALSTFQCEYTQIVSSETVEHRFVPKRITHINKTNFQIIQFSEIFSRKRMQSTK